MLTALHPEIYRTILSYPIGVMAVADPEGGSPYLVVKATKEFILAAKVTGFVKTYVCPASMGGQDTQALIFAFFDDEDEPLIIRTPLVDDEESRALKDALLCTRVKVHFFDEHGRELLIYEAELDIPDVARERLENMPWLKGSFLEAQEMLQNVGLWFGLRIPQDDQEAITIRLAHNPYGDTIAINDMRYPLHQHHGAKGFSISMLERNEPGNFQEEDIIKCLVMCFPQDQIYHSPKRTTDKEEICDILLVTDDRVLIIQAKDSPNIDRIVQQKMSRKRTASQTAFKKALGQVRGAHSYIRDCKGSLRYILNDEEHFIDISDKTLFSIIVLKEVFERDGEEYATALNALMTERKMPCFVISYGLFFELCYRVHDSKKFLQFSEEVVDYICHSQDLPVINFHG